MLQCFVQVTEISCSLFSFYSYTFGFNVIGNYAAFTESIVVMEDTGLALPGIEKWLVIGFSAYVCNGSTL